MSRSDSNLQTYIRFGKAIAAGDTDAMRRFVDEESFLALLPGAKVGIDFTHFAGELERQRAAFSDFGKHVDIVDFVSNNNKLAVFTLSTVTFDGILVDWASPTKLRPTGNQIRISSMDFVTFNNYGRIVQLVVVSDRFATLAQMGAL